MERCQAESYCKAFNEQRTNCHIHCIGYIQIRNIYSMSNMPKKYQFGVQLVAPSKDLGSYVFLRDWMEKVEENVQAGKGLFLYSGNKGNGKTSWACKIMNEYFRKVAMTNNLRCRGLFINVPDFLQKLRDNMNDPSDEVAEMLENIYTADLLIWDDIGTETPSNWVRERLYTYINHRESNNLSQIYTSNLPVEVLEQEKYLGERIASRIAGQCDIIEFQGEDRRIQRG